MSRKVHGIKRAGTPVELDASKIKELVRCSKDPIYFIKNHVKVRHPTMGVVPFALYPYQEDLIKVIHENRNSIILSARQTGKCCFFSTTINIKKERTNIFSRYILKLFNFIEEKLCKNEITKK